MNKLSEMLDEDVVVKLEEMKDSKDNVLKTDKEIIETELNVPVIPLDGRILVKPLDEVKVVKKVVVPIEDENTNSEELLETEEREEEVVSNLRVGVVLTTDPATDYNFNIGDKVVYIHRAAMPFDLYKDSVLLKKYDILGLWVK